MGLALSMMGSFMDLSRLMGSNWSCPGYHASVQQRTEGVVAEASVTTDKERDLLERALTGSSADMSALVLYIQPVIHARVARALVTSGGGARRNLREEVEDMAQEVYTVLFERDAKVLRAWSPARGLSLRNFIGMVARRKANAVMSVRKRNPWYEEPMEGDAVERAIPHTEDAEAELVARQFIGAALKRTAETQSERGQRLLQWMLVEGKSNEEIRGLTAMSDNAIYQWRSRLTRALRHHIDLMSQEARDAGEATYGGETP
jgi:DNA-directed RNA polymerase specialized sigma24 family protein